MSEGKQVQTDDDVYRPLSGPALAGFGLAMLYALGISILSVTALVNRVPLVELPLGALWFIAGVLAFVLSLWGYFQVSRSEGTRAGLPLARWGMIVSALFGLGYLAWNVAREQAVKTEAQEFTAGWLRRVIDSRAGADARPVAFWYILDPQQRDPRFPVHDPRFAAQLQDHKLRRQFADYVHFRYAYGAAEQRALFPIFCESELLQLLGGSADQPRVEPLGLRSWSYRGKAQGGYHVELNYRISTAEGTFPALISVLSSEGSNLPGRQWQVLLQGSGLDPPSERQLTPLGQTVMALRLDSREFARSWFSKLVGEQRREAFLETLPPAERPPLRALARTAPAVGPLANSEFGWKQVVPGYAEFAAGGPVRASGLIADPTVADTIIRHVKGYFHQGPTWLARMPPPMVANDDAQLTSGWYRAREKPAVEEVIFVQPFMMRIPARSAKDDKPLGCEGRVLVGTSHPLLLGALASGSSVQLPAGQRSLRWRVVGVELTFGTILPRESGRPRDE